MHLRHRRESTGLLIGRCPSLILGSSAHSGQICDGDTESSYQDDVSLVRPRAAVAASSQMTDTRAGTRGMDIR